MNYDHVSMYLKVNMIYRIIIIFKINKISVDLLEKKKIQPKQNCEWTVDRYKNKL